MALETAQSFEKFGELPKELRLLIFEYYFQGPRIHVVFPAPESRGHVTARDTLFLHTASLDAGTNIHLGPGPPAVAIDHEAYAAAAQAGVPVGEPVHLARDLVEPTASWRQDTNIPLRPASVSASVSVSVSVSVSSSSEEPRPASRAVCVDWAHDLLYIAVPHAEHAFWALKFCTWAKRIRRLAVLIPQNDEPRVPLGPYPHIEEVLKAMSALEALSVVWVPPQPVTRATCSGLPRDPYGFVPYREYLRRTGLIPPQMSFSRAALTFQKALQGRTSVKLTKVVDVDCVHSGANGYQRRRRGAQGEHVLPDQRAE